MAMTEEEALAIARARDNYRRRQAAQGPSALETAGGAAAQFGAGALKGTGQTLDMMFQGSPPPPPEERGPIESAFQDFMGNARELVGIPREGIGSFQEGIASATGGFSERQPTNTLERFTGTMGEFAPGMVMGPGGLGRKAFQTVVGGGLSEAAGELAEEYAPAYEGVARFAGGLAGGVVAAGKSPNNIAMRTARQVARRSASPEVLASTRKAVYDQLDQAGIRYDSLTYSKLGQEITDDLIKNQHRPSNAQQAFDEANNILKSGLMNAPPPPPKPVRVGKTKGAVSTRVRKAPPPEPEAGFTGGSSPSFTDLERYSQRLGQDVRTAYRQGNYSLGDALAIVREHVDDFQINAPFIAGPGVSAQQVNRWRDIARQLGLRNIKARRLNEMYEDADNHAGGFLAGLRAQINRALLNKADKQLFNKNDRELLKAVRDGKKSITALQSRGLSLRPPNLSQHIEQGSIPLQVGIAMAHPSTLPMIATGTGIALSRVGKMLEPHRAARRMETAIGAIGDPTFDATYAANTLAASRTRTRQAMALLNSGAVGAREDRHKKQEK